MPQLMNTHIFARSSGNRENGISGAVTPFRFFRRRLFGKNGLLVKTHRGTDGIMPARR